MGSINVKAIRTTEERQQITHSILNDVSALEQMIENDSFEKGIVRIGAEQEFCLVREDFTPSYNALELLEKVNDPNFTTELAKFNLEINLDPEPFEKSCFSNLENQLTQHLEKITKVAEDSDTNIVLTGILPTLRIKDLHKDMLTPLQRYHTLNSVLTSLRNDAFKLQIRGADELKFRLNSIMFEACNTSFQVHLQVEPSNAISRYNWAQAISGPILSAMTNSPILLGKELWSETRIALFQQSIDLRTKSHLLRGQKPRVYFGDSWVKDSLIELFTDDIVRYPPIITSEEMEDSLEKLNSGIMPKLRALNLYNGTLYKWNRMCYGVCDNVAHLRIENRYIPSGPTSQDEIANTMFWVGVMLGMPEKYKEIWKYMEFKEARANFFKAARYGLNTYFNWFGKDVAANDLILNELLPLAYKTLVSEGIETEEVEKYLTIIKERVQTRRTGSRWITFNKRRLNKKCTDFDTHSLLTKYMHYYQQQNIPVHLWEDINVDHACEYKTMDKVYKIMSREVYVVSENDPLELIASVMQWKNIRHVPVVNSDQKVVGVITKRTADEYKDEKGICASDIMNTDFISIHPNTTIEETQELLDKHEKTSLIVTYKGELFGIITEKDIKNLKES